MVLSARLSLSLTDLTKSARGRFTSLYYMILLISLAGCSTPSAPRMVNLSTSAGPEFVHHIIQQGESLGLIAEWYSGQASTWNEIFMPAARGSYKNLKEGDVVLIPRRIAVRTDPPSASFIEEYKARLSKSGLTKRKLARSGVEGENVERRAEEVVPPGEEPAATRAAESATTSAPTEEASPKPSVPTEQKDLFVPEDEFMEHILGGGKRE